MIKNNGIHIYDVLFRALNYSNDIKAARQNIQATGQEVNISNASYLPQVKSISNLGYLDERKALTDLRGRSYTMGVEVTQRLYSFNRREYQLNIADTLEQEAIADYNKTESDVLYEAGLAFIQSLQADKVLRLRERHLKSLQEELNNKEIELSQGRVIRHEVNELRSLLLQANANKIRAQSKLRLYKKNLSKYVGFIPDELSYNKIGYVF